MSGSHWSVRTNTRDIAMEEDNKDKNGMMADFQVSFDGPIYELRRWARKGGHDCRIHCFVIIHLCLCYPGHHWYRRCCRSFDAFVQLWLGPIGLYILSSFFALFSINFFLMIPRLRFSLLFNVLHHNTPNICRLKDGVLV